MLVVAMPAMAGALALALATTEAADRWYLLLSVPFGAWGIIALLRPRWSLGLRAAGLIAPLVVGVVVTYLRFGFKGNASAMVALIVVLTGLFFGRTKMTATVLLAFLVAGAIGAGMISGLIQGDPRHTADLDRPLAWIRTDMVALLIWITVGSVVVFVIEHIEGALRGTREALASLEIEHQHRLDAESDRQRAQEALVRAQRTELVSQLAAGVAHDFNNVLSVIATWWTAVQQEAPATGAREAARRAVASALQQGQALTRQLTVLARPEVRSVRRFRLDGPALAAVETLRLAMPPGVELAFDAPVVPEVEADEIEIQQIIYNLVLNARDAMPDGGSIQVTIGLEVRPTPSEVVGGTLPAGRWVTLAVKDSGTGIEPAFRERIFDLFFTTKGPDHGTGLGLATVLRIAKESGGGVALETEVGRGATFKLYLPA
jgi:signal transduction histidine kinase